MEFDSATLPEKQLSRWISVGIVGAAALLGLAVLCHANHSPRTDDAEVFANFIGIAPQVEGPIVRLNVRDNQFVKKGELLYEIDERPYQYALQRALSEQAALEGQIVDEQRRINALVSGVSVAKANVSGSQADVARGEAAVEQARADVHFGKSSIPRSWKIGGLAEFLPSTAKLDLRKVILFGCLVRVAAEQNSQRRMVHGS